MKCLQTILGSMAVLASLASANNLPPDSDTSLSIETSSYSADKSSSTGESGRVSGSDSGFSSDDGSGSDSGSGRGYSGESNDDSDGLNFSGSGGGGGNSYHKDDKYNDSKNFGPGNSRRIGEVSVFMPAIDNEFLFLKDENDLIFTSFDSYATTIYKTECPTNDPEFEKNGLKGTLTIAVAAPLSIRYSVDNGPYLQCIRSSPKNDYQCKGSKFPGTVVMSEMKGDQMTLTLSYVRSAAAKISGAFLEWTGAIITVGALVGGASMMGLSF